MALRLLLLPIALATTLMLSPLPAAGQHGQDPLPPQASTSPNGANPTEQSVTEQRLLQQLGKLEGRVSIPDYKASLLQQPQGRSYQTFHESVLPWLSGLLIVLMLAALGIFYFTHG